MQKLYKRQYEIEAGSEFCGNTKCDGEPSNVFPLNPILREMFYLKNFMFAEFIFEEGIFNQYFFKMDKAVFVLDKYTTLCLNLNVYIEIR